MYGQTPEMNLVHPVNQEVNIPVNCALSGAHLSYLASSPTSSRCHLGHYAPDIKDRAQHTDAIVFDLVQL